MDEMTVVFKTPVKHNGIAYGVGAIVDLPALEAAGLAARGSVDVVVPPKPKAKAKKKKAKVSDE